MSEATAPERPAQNPPVQLRTFVFPDDYEAVIHLWQNAGSGMRAGRSDTPEEIAKKLERDPELFLVAESSESTGVINKIVGAVLGGFDGRRGFMYHLAVAESWRHLGVATALIDELELRLRALGCLRYYLLVLSDNLNAQAYYEKRGWERMTLHTYAKDL